MNYIWARAGLALALSVAAPSLCLGGAPPVASELQLHLWGTGFVVDHEGHLLTADHVSRDCGAIDVVRGGARARAVVEAHDQANDLSLLRASPDIGAPAEFANDNRITRGSFVLIVDYPAAQDFDAGGGPGRMLFNGMVMPQPSNDAAAPARFYIVSDARPGSSGSPVIDGDGRVAAVIAAKLSWRGGMPSPGRPSELRLAIAGAVAKGFLREHHIDFVEGSSMAHRSVRTLDLLRNSEVRVECRG